MNNLQVNNLVRECREFIAETELIGTRNLSLEVVRVVLFSRLFVNDFALRVLQNSVDIVLSASDDLKRNVIKVKSTTTNLIFHDDVNAGFYLFVKTLICVVRQFKRQLNGQRRRYNSQQCTQNPQAHLECPVT
jgi:hypothetical protein